ncbi:MAG: mechanosensitive ion channel family protein [Ardenticatenaceae bacterium]
MAQDGFLDFLLDLLAKLQLFIARPSVQVQLIAMAAILGGIGFVSSVIIVALKRRQKKSQAESEHNLYQRLFFTGTTLLLFPILALIATNITNLVLLSQNRAVGLLRLLAFLLSALLGYRVFLLLLYTLFPKERVRRFQTRLFSPLFALFVLYQIVQLFVNVNVLVTMALFVNLLENPVTLGALFLATVGLYFWIDSISGLNEVIFLTATRFTSVNAGRLEASLTLGGYILIVLGIILALTLLGVSSTTFAAIMGGLSVGIGFGLKEVLSNFISGILLLFEGTIRPGDKVDISGQVVTIKKLGIRATVVRSNDNVEIIVPNQELLVSSVTSYTATDTIVRLKIPITSDHDYDPEKIIQILEETARQNPNILPERKVAAIIKAIGGGGIDYELRVWFDISTVGPAALKNQLYRAINKAFVEHNIEVNPDPDMDQFLKLASTFLERRRQPSP